MLTVASGCKRLSLFRHVGLPILFVVGFGGFSDLFPVRCNASIGLLDHDEAYHGCSCKNPFLFSDCQRYTLKQKVRCALHPVVPALQDSSISPLTSTTVTSCGSQHWLSVVQCRPTLGSSRRFVETQASFQVGSNFKGHLERVPTCSKSHRKKICHLERYTTQPLPVASSHRVQTGKAAQSAQRSREPETLTAGFVVEFDNAKKKSHSQVCAIVWQATDTLGIQIALW